MFPNSNLGSRIVCFSINLMGWSGLPPLKRHFLWGLIDRSRIESPLFRLSYASYNFISRLSFLSGGDLRSISWPPCRAFPWTATAQAINFCTQFSSVGVALVWLSFFIVLFFLYLCLYHSVLFILWVRLGLGMQLGWRCCFCWCLCLSCSLCLGLCLCHSRHRHSPLDFQLKCVRSMAIELVLLRSRPGKELSAAGRQLCVRLYPYLCISQYLTNIRVYLHLCLCVSVSAILCLCAKDSRTGCECRVG